MAQQRQQFGSLALGDQVGIRIPGKIQTRIRRTARPDKSRRLLSPLVVFLITLSLGLLLTLLAFRSLSKSKENEIDLEEDVISRRNSTAFSKELKFGRGSGAAGRDSRYWDRDDRRRDQDYEENDVLARPTEQNEHKHDQESKKEGKERNGGGGGLYNEGGRAELETYKEEYENSLKMKNNVEEDEYDDDGIDAEDEVEEQEGSKEEEENKKAAIFSVKEKVSSQVARNAGSSGSKGEKSLGSGKRTGSKRKPKHHKFSGSSCEMKFLNSTAQLVEPVENKKFSRFSLQYVEVEERPNESMNWEPKFAGHQTLQEREESFYARDQKINCGFVKGPKGSPSTGFDLAEDDVRYMKSCHIAVSSCIFGNSDHLRTPYSKLITKQSRKNVCFVMFMDEQTLQTLSSEGQKMDNMGYIGLWKIIVVRNLPYTDMRRVGKVPKFLAHRLFPSARYSIWLDSKLRLQRDPSLILEYFLWRKGYEYAISNHYDRHCVWEEVLQNKKLNKFNHSIIDQQFEFYQSDGLKRFDPSDPNKLLPSHVPEGSFIVRAHTPMSNLFSCLWFNEVERFTPRDQLSFAYTYLKLRKKNPKKTFHLNMFKDCERRSITKLYRHRAEDRRNLSTQAMR